KLSVDAGKLKSALTTNLIDVQSLFGTNGTATDGQVSFIGGTSVTKPGTYAVEITTAATRASHTGSAIPGGTYTATNGVSDQLTITDSYSGRTVNFTATQGTSIAQIAADLTALFANEGVGMTAEVVGDALKLDSTDYGSSTTFELSGDATAGLGVTAGAYAGTDVAGTIGGPGAVGTGRGLTGAAGGHTQGLAIGYTGGG